MLRKGERKEHMNFSTIELFKNIPFDVDYRNTMDFDTEVLQNKFFTTGDYASGEDGRLTISNCLYVDYTRGSVRIEGSQGSLYAYNYMRYKNADRDKWYYAFILSKKYLSDGSTELTFSIDVIQTFMFNYHIAQGFVERGHVDRFKKSGTDIIPTIFDNNINSVGMKSIENINTNSYVYRDVINIFFKGVTKWIFITFSKPFNKDNYTSSDLIPQTYTCCIPYSPQNRTFRTEATAPFYSLSELTKNDAINANIVSISVGNFPGFIYNESLDGNEITISNLPVTRLVFEDSVKVVGVPAQISNAYLDTETSFTLNQLLSKEFYEFIPIQNPNKNKNIDCEYKLQFPPFSYFCIGTKSNIKDYSLVNIDNISKYKIKVKALYGFSNNYSIILDAYYGSHTPDKVYSFEFNNASLLPNNSDSLYQYLQNKQSGVVVSSVITSLIGAITTIFTMNPAPAAIGALMGAQNIHNNYINAQNAPDNVSMQIDGLNALLFNDDRPFVCKKRVDESFYKSCYDYLYKFGYTLSVICDDIESFYKTRYWFNFVKTKDIEFDGSTIDTAVFEEQLKGIYNSGITFWHYNNGNYKFCEYDKENVERAIM